MPGTLSPDVYLRGDNGQLRQTDGTSDVPVNGWLGGVVAATVAASTAHTSTTTEALLASYSIPAATLVAGSNIEVEWAGIATGTTNTDTLTVKLYIGGLGGTVIATGTGTDIANNACFFGRALIQVRTAGDSGTLVAMSTHSKVPAASLTASPVFELIASTTLNTNAAQVVGVGLDWSTADTTNSARVDIFRVKIYYWESPSFRISQCLCTPTLEGIFSAMLRYGGALRLGNLTLSPVPLATRSCRRTSMGTCAQP